MEGSIGMVAAPVLYGVMLRRPNPAEGRATIRSGHQACSGRGRRGAVATCLALLGAGCGGSEAEPPVDGPEGREPVARDHDDVLLDLMCPRPTSSAGRPGVEAWTRRR